MDQDRTVAGELFWLEALGALEALEVTMLSRRTQS